MNFGIAEQQTRFLIIPGKTHLVFNVLVQKWLYTKIATFVGYVLDFGVSLILYYLIC